VISARRFYFFGRSTSDAPRPMSSMPRIACHRGGHKRRPRALKPENPWWNHISATIFKKNFRPHRHHWVTPFFYIPSSSKLSCMLFFLCKVHLLCGAPTPPNGTSCVPRVPGASVQPGAWHVAAPSRLDCGLFNGIVESVGPIKFLRTMTWQ
jgi:hypothetical protein